MGALAMHGELRFADNLLDIVFGAVGLVLVFMLYGTMVGFPYVVVCTVLLAWIKPYRNLRGFAHVLWGGGAQYAGCCKIFLCITTAQESRLRCKQPQRWRC